MEGPAKAYDLVVMSELIFQSPCRTRRHAATFFPATAYGICEWPHTGGDGGSGSRAYPDAAYLLRAPDPQHGAMPPLVLGKGPIKKYFN